MIRSYWACLSFLLLSSCGIISIEYLPPPPVPDPTVNQNDFTKLTFDHSSATYNIAHPDFQGYEVYYKIYAPVTGPFDNLAADNSQLIANTPTRDYLITMGYQRMNASESSATVPPLAAVSPSVNATITLDFSSFLDTMNVSNPPTQHPGSPLPPIPTIQVGSSTPVPVYRTTSATGVFSYPWFSDLYKSWPGAASSDMQKGTGSNAISNATQFYQIAVFLVAYSFTPEQTIYSQPVPWGVIGGNSANYLKVF